MAIRKSALELFYLYHSRILHHLTWDRVILLICTVAAPTTTTLVVKGTDYNFRRNLFCLRVYNQNRHPGTDACRSVTLQKNACLFFTASTYRKLMDVYCSAWSDFCYGQRKDKEHWKSHHWETTFKCYLESSADPYNLLQPFAVVS